MNPFELAMTSLERNPVTEIKRDGTLCRYTVEISSGVVNNVWVDCERGYTIAKVEMHVFDAKKNEWKGPLVKSELQWEQRKSVWVPTTLHLERDFNGKEIYSIKLDWVSVNEEPDPKLFEPSGLGLDPDFTLADSRGGKTVAIGKISGEKLRPSYSPASRRRTLYWWIGGGLIAVIAGVWWNRARKA